jgi:hypothetical protein
MARSLIAFFLSDVVLLSLKLYSFKELVSPAAVVFAYLVND